MELEKVEKTSATAVTIINCTNSSAMAFSRAGSRAGASHVSRIAGDVCQFIHASTA
jgi:hypothetical protein